MTKRLSGKTALVTGSSRGVGRLVATALAEQGCSTVYCHGRTEAACRSTAEAVAAAGARPIIVAADLADPEQVESLVNLVLEGGGVDILYNNAGVQQTWRNDLSEMTREDWTYLFQINVFALVRITTRLLGPMRERGWGRIINLTSGIDKTPQLAAYGASKWAVNKWTDDLAAALEGTGVIVSRLDPGWLSTDLGGPNADNKPETVLPGALVPALLSDDAKGGQFFRAQELRDYRL